MNHEKLRLIVKKIKSEWSSPRTAFHFGEECPFLLTSSFSAGATERKISKIPTQMRSELKELWRISEKTELFKDQLYQQWGIEILTPEECITETSNQQYTRAKDVHENDLIFGRFYGDSELLLITDKGNILLCMPLDPRKEWPELAKTLSDFLENLIKSQGAKYWEPPKPKNP